MGKSNFPAHINKIAELERKIYELESRNEILQSTIDKMLCNQTANTRSLYLEMEHEKIEKLFSECVDADNGSFFFDNRNENLNQLFNTFSQGIIRRILPYPHYDKRTKKFYIKNTPLKDMSDEQFEIIVETFQAIVDTMCYAKDKLEKSDDEQQNT